MNNTVICLSDNNETTFEQKFNQRAKVLAEQLALPVVEFNEARDYQFKLFYDKEVLTLVDSHDQSSGSVWVDFTKGKTAYRQKHQGKGKLPISKACGIKHGKRPTVIDATAGLGQDAFLLAGLGCNVICIEQNPVVAALLEDGLVRAVNCEQNIRDSINRMRLIKGLAEEVLLTNTAEVIYLDPMYPHLQNKKQAKVKKGMHLFRTFPGTSSDELLLYNAALLSATDRVVVKRPDWASPLAKQLPTYEIKSKNHRYDVYKKALTTSEH